MLEIFRTLFTRQSVAHSATPVSATSSFRGGIVIGFVFAMSVLISPAMAQGSPYEQAFTAYQNQKFVEAENLWTELASAGDVNAQYALGVMHLRREATDASPVAAFSWFEKAADKGHPTAMFNLGVAYWEGTGVEQDKSRALELWQQAAEQGDSGAQFNLGLAYYIGEERAPDLALARSWISEAANQNHPEAQRILKVIESEMLTPAAPQPVASDPGSDAVVVASTAVLEDTTTEAAETASVDTQVLNQYWKTKGNPTAIFNKPDGISFRELPPGTPLEINGQDGGWARITVPDGLRTWVYSKFIDIEGDNGVINADSVRVRPAPSTDNDVSPSLGRYSRGDEVRVLGVEQDWVEIRAPKKVSAWIKVENIVEYQDTAENRATTWQRASDAGA